MSVSLKICFGVHPDNGFCYFFRHDWTGRRDERDCVENEFTEVVINGCKETNETRGRREIERLLDAGKRGEGDENLKGMQE